MFHPPCCGLSVCVPRRLLRCAPAARCARAGEVLPRAEPPGQPPAGPSRRARLRPRVMAVPSFLLSSHRAELSASSWGPGPRRGLRLHSVTRRLALSSPEPNRERAPPRSPTYHHPAQAVLQLQPGSRRESCFWLLHGVRLSFPLLSASARRLSEKRFGILGGGPVEIKCTVAARLLSLYVCPAGKGGRRPRVGVSVRAWKGLSPRLRGAELLRGGSRPIRPATDA